MNISVLNLFPRLFLLLVLASFHSFVFAGECAYTNVNNVIQPSAEHDKDSICNSWDVKAYGSLFYYSGAKAVCSDNKAAYCAILAERTQYPGNMHWGKVEGLVSNEGSLPLEEQYWVKAFNFCGFEYKKHNNEYLENLAKGGSPNAHLEKNGTPKQVATLAERICGGGRSYSSGSSSHSAWCGKNYKKADPRAKKAAQEANTKEVVDNNAPVSYTHLF